MSTIHCKIRFRQFLITVLVILMVCIMFNVNYTPPLYSNFLVSDTRMFKGRSPTKKFAIYTSGCKIPEVDPFDVSIKKFIGKPQPFHCPCEQGFGLTYMDNGVLKVNTDIGSRFGVDLRNASNFDCCMWAMFRHESEEQDDFMRFPEDCAHFKTSIPVESEYIKAECYLNQARIHETFYSNLIRKLPVEERCNKAGKNCNVLGKFGVIILFLDSMSRINFHRNFPESQQVLADELHAIELNGYNRVGDNTFPNLIPLIAGISESQLRDTCWRNETDHFDDCKFIWSDFATAGFRTAFVEDYPDIGAFHFEKSGFRIHPTDYYAHNYLKEAYKLMYNQRDCLNGIPETEMVIKWCYDFMNFFREERHFGIFSTSRFTHSNDVNMANLADPILKKYLRMMMYDGLLKNTFLFVMSDHGVRYGEFRETIIGAREVNLPAMHIVLPESFQTHFPKSYQNLVENANRLISPYDIHETLRDIVHCSLDPTKPPQNQTASKRLHQAVSLFRKISENRTCAEVGIPIGYCACFVSEVILEPTSDVIQRSLIVLVDKLNNLTEPYRELCAVFLPEYIIRAREIKFLNTNNKLESYYELIFGVEPGSGMFQGIVTLGPTNDQLIANEEISRVNIYGSSSDCISNNSKLRQYCFCIKKA